MRLLRFEDTYGMFTLHCMVNKLEPIEVSSRVYKIGDDYCLRGLTVSTCLYVSHNTIMQFRKRYGDNVICVFDVDPLRNCQDVMTASDFIKATENNPTCVRYAPVIRAAETLVFAARDDEVNEVHEPVAALCKRLESIRKGINPKHVHEFLDIDCVRDNLEKYYKKY